MNWATPFQHEMMLTAFGLGAFIAAVCAVLSCFLVLKGWSLMGDAISHAVLPGVVLAYVAGIPLVVGAFATGLLCAVGTGFVKNHTRLREDTAMGVLFTGLFALGLVLYVQVESDQHLTHILFGNVLGILPKEAWTMGIAGGITLGLTLLLRRDLFLFCFDPTHARSIGLPTPVLHYVFLGLLSLTIVAAMQAVGIILVIAMLVGPGVTGFLWCESFGRMMIVSVGSAVASAVMGIYASFFLNVSSSPCMVLVQTVFFVLALVTSRKRGLRASGKR